VTVLSGQQGLSSRAAADALAAVAVLEGHDSAAALQAFLSARQQWVQQQLDQAAQGQAGEAPGAVLAALAQTVQSCVAQVRALLGSSCLVGAGMAIGWTGDTFTQVHRVVQKAQLEERNSLSRLCSCLISSVR
jgi:hypothetical protein